MHTRVGPSRADDMHVLLRDLFDDGFDFALDRRVVGLDLPAGIAGAVVGNRQFKFWHRADPGD